MLNRLFPKQIDNDFRGPWIAAGLFVLIVLIKGVQGFESIFDTRNTVINADGIPLDRFDPAGAQTALALFALLGFYVLIVPLQSLVVLIRYRAAIPLMFLTLLIVQLAARAIATLHPVVRASTPAIGYAGHPIGYYINLAILAVTLAGFVLSLMERKKPARLAAE